MKNENMKIVGVTGPSGSGKSTLCKIFESKGAYIIDADAVGHEILKHNEKCKQDLTQAFSDTIISQGQIDRRKLAQKAFASKDQTELLNFIMYPYILLEISKILFEYRQNNVHLCIIDAAQLFESGLDKFCDEVLAVLAPYETRLKRIMKRDGLTLESAKQRLAAQNNDEFYKRQTPYILDGTNLPK